MSVDWFSGWPFALRGALAFIVAIAVAELVHFILYACLRRAQKWRPTFSAGLFIRHTSGPAHPLLILLADNDRPGATRHGGLGH